MSKRSRQMKMEEPKMQGGWERPSGKGPLCTPITESGKITATYIGSRFTSDKGQLSKKGK